MKMRHVSIDVPRFVDVEADLLTELGKICEEFSFKEIFLLSGERTYQILGKTVEEALMIDYVVRNSLINDSEVTTFTRLRNEVQQGEFDLVIGVGGGKIANMGKLLAGEAGIPYVYIPTTASNDGIASPIATLRERGKPRSLATKPPTAVLVDLNVIKQSPRRLLCSGVGDLVSNITANKDWLLGCEKKGEDFDEIASALATTPAELVLSRAEGFDLGQEKDLLLLIRGLIMSGMAMASYGSSRPASGSEHKFSHAIDLINPGSGFHGEQVGIGTILMEYLYEKRYGEGEWKRVRALLERVGAPTTLEQIGISGAELPKVLNKVRSIRPGRYTLMDEVKLEDIMSAAAATGIIK